MPLKLKDRLKPPPNGYLYKQKQTGWCNWLVVPESVWDFKLCARAIQQHRLANPRFKLNTNLVAIEDELDRVNAERVAAIPNASIYIQQTGGPTAPFSQTRPGRALSAVAGSIAKMAQGTGTLIDWVADGAPAVTPEESDRRSKICLVCPQNSHSDMTSFFTKPASELIRKQLEKLNALHLVTQQDPSLGVCLACSCPLKLKVHTPLDYIKAHMSEQTKKDLDPKCWILEEK